MQIRSKFPFLLLIAAVFFFSSCSKTNKEGRYVPSNAGFVIHLNGKSLDSKLPWDEIKKSELFKELYADSTTPPIIKSVMENPENTGIDVKTDILIFAVKDSNSGYGAVEGTLKDAAKFKQFNNSIDKKPATETEKDGIHYLNNGKMTAAWKDDRFVYVMDVPGLNSRNKYTADSFDSAGNYIPMPEIKKDLNAVAAQIFALKEDNSLGKDEKFTDLVKTSGDIHFWMNIEALDLGSMGNMPGSMEMMKMINLKKIYEGSRIAATIDFGNGKINADFVSYSGKEMTELVKKYSGDKISTDMLKRIPSKDIAGLFALNFKPEGIREYLKLLGVEGFANMGAAFLGFSLDDFIKANKGDILLAVTDLSRDSNGRHDMSVIFSASIGDRPSFDKLIMAGKKLSKDKFMDAETERISYNISDKYFAIGNNKQAVDKYISTAGNNNADIIDKIAGNSSGAYINIQYILKSLSMEASRDSIDNLVYDASVKMWDNLVATGTGFHNGGTSQHVEINLVDKNTNSLKQLHDYLSNIGRLQKSRPKVVYNYNEESIVDSVKVVR